MNSDKHKNIASGRTSKRSCRLHDRTVYSCNLLNVNCFSIWFCFHLPSRKMLNYAQLPTDEMVVSHGDCLYNLLHLVTAQQEENVRTLHQLHLHQFLAKSLRDVMQVVTTTHAIQYSKSKLTKL